MSWTWLTPVFNITSQITCDAAYHDVTLHDLDLGGGVYLPEGITAVYLMMLYGTGAGSCIARCNGVTTSPSSYLGSTYSFYSVVVTADASGIIELSVQANVNVFIVGYNQTAGIWHQSSGALVNVAPTFDEAGWYPGTGDNPAISFDLCSPAITSSSQLAFLTGRPGTGNPTYGYRPSGSSDNVTARHIASTVSLHPALLNVGETELYLSAALTGIYYNGYAPNTEFVALETPITVDANTGNADYEHKNLTASINDARARAVLVQLKNGNAATKMIAVRHPSDSTDLSQMIISATSQVFAIVPIATSDPTLEIKTGDYSTAVVRILGYFGDITTTPTLATATVDTITKGSAKAYGNVTSDGGSPPVTERGVCWGTSANPTIAGDHTAYESGGTGAYEIDITGLDSHTDYHLRTYATNSNGTAYSADLLFSTLPQAVPVVTGAVETVDKTTIDVSGIIVDADGGDISEAGFCWGTSENPTTSDSHYAVADPYSDYTYTIPSLTAGTVYNIRAYAINQAGTGYSQNIAVETLLNAILGGGMGIEIGIELENSGGGGSLGRILLPVTSINKTDEKIVTVTIQLTNPAPTGGRAIFVDISGAKSSQEDFGFGKHYTLSGDYTGTPDNWTYEYTRMTFNFAEGESSKSFSMNFEDNGVLEIDRIITISGLGTYRFTLIDDNIPEIGGYKNIIRADKPNEDYYSGATYTRTYGGNPLVGIAEGANNSTPFTNILNWLNTNGGGIVYIPAGTYGMAGVSIPMSATTKGITIHGESRETTTIEKYFAGNPMEYNTTVNTLATNQTWNPGSEYTSSPVSIKNVILDGAGVKNCINVTVVSVPDEGDIASTYYYYDAGNRYKMKFTATPSNGGDPYSSDGFTVIDIDISGPPSLATLRTRIITAMEREDFLNAQCWEIVGSSVSFNSNGPNDEYLLPLYYGTGASPDINTHIPSNNNETAKSFITGPNDTYVVNANWYTVNAEMIGITNTPGQAGFDITSNTIARVYQLTDYGVGAYIGSFEMTGCSTVELSAISVVSGHIEMTAESYYPYNTPYYKYNIKVYNSDTGLGFSRPTGGFDAGSILEFYNTVLRFTYTGQDALGNSPTAPHKFENCDISIIYANYPCNATFTGCNFTTYGQDDATLSYVVPITIPYPVTAAHLVTWTFDECTFENGSEVVATTQIGVGLRSYVGVDGDGLPYMKVVVKNSEFNSAFDFCVGGVVAGASGTQGGWWVLGPGNIYGTADIHPDYIACLINHATYKARVEIDGTDSVVNTNGFLWTQGMDIAGGVLHCSDLELTAAQNSFYFNSSNWAGLAANLVLDKFPGATSNDMRLITGTEAPVDGTTFGLAKDGTVRDKYTYGETTKHCTSTANRTWE